MEPMQLPSMERTTYTWRDIAMARSVSITPRLSTIRLGNNSGFVATTGPCIPMTMQQPLPLITQALFTSPVIATGQTTTSITLQLSTTRLANNNGSVAMTEPGATMILLKESALMARGIYM